MRINFIIATLLVIFIVAIAGCTSPTPSPATVSPTAVPTAIVNASPTPIANASPSAAVTASAMPSQLATMAMLSASDISIDWDTTDIMQHDTVHLNVKNNYQYMLLDVNVVYTVTTQGLIVNPDNTSYVQNQTVPAVTSPLGVMSSGAVKEVTIQSDHRKNVPAFITIQGNWRDGSVTLFKGVLITPDHAVGTKTF